jgi:3-oxoacyl-[acyl-carrier protein] reductase
MDLELSGRNVLIAGSSAGIGRAIAAGFLSEGANVAISGRTADTVNEAAQQLREGAPSGAKVVSFMGDMTTSEAVDAALESAEAELGPLSCVVANVGIGRAPLGYEVSDEDWEADLRQNLLGSMYLARSAMRRMIQGSQEERLSSSIIFISSIAGVEALGSSLTYGASKAALNHSSMALAKIAGRHRIRVNTVVPGNVIFPGGNWERNVTARPEAWERWVNREVALQRFGRPEEIADAVVWLASPRSSFVTGASIVVDGGQLRSL